MRSRRIQRLRTGLTTRQAGRRPGEYHRVETCDESFQQIGEASAVTTVETIECLAHRRESSHRKPLLHGAPILACTDHRHSLVSPMRAPLRQTRVDEPGNGSRCRGRLDAQRHRKLVHGPLTMLDEEIKSVHLPQVELWFGRRPRVPAHSACRWTTAKSPPGDGNALRVVLTTARTDPAPRDESCSGGHVALRCATHHLIP